MECILCEDGNLISAIYNTDKEWDIFCNTCGPATVTKKQLSVDCPVCKEPAIFDSWKTPGDPSDYGLYILCFHCRYDSRACSYCPGCEEKTLITRIISPDYYTQEEEYRECLYCGLITDPEYEDLPY